MRIGPFLGVVFAVVLHAAFILFGGLLFPAAKKDHGTLQQVALLSNEDVTAEKKPEEPKEPTEEKIEAKEEEAPDVAEIIRSNAELSAAALKPELQALSLGEIDAALGGKNGGVDFGGGVVSLAGDGVIGGKGRRGAGGDKLDRAFDLSEIDQKPRAVFQSAPLYPAELRSKKIEGVATIIFIVNAAGKVENARVEKSTHPAFSKPALDAVRKWKFEPAVRAGQRVACKMRVPVRFQPS
ncbi:MAG: energy transducer TonB [Phycisphaerales bacterium]